MRRESLDALLNRGEIPSYRRGKTRFVHTSDLDAWMRSLPSGAVVPAALIPRTDADSPTTTTEAA